MMQQVLRLNWPRCIDGYDLVQFDSSKVVWSLYESSKNANQPQLTFPEQRFLNAWGMRLSVFEKDDKEEFWFLPRSERFEAPDVLAKEPLLFSKLAEARDSDTKIHRFVNDHGPLWNDQPCSLGSVNTRAKLMHSLIEKRKSEQRRRTFEWLDTAKQSFNTGFDSDISLSAEVRDKNIEFVLRPANLRIGLIVQFIFASSRNLRINQCLVCKNIISKGPKLNRIDRKYCSSACRQQSYRSRSSG